MKKEKKKITDNSWTSLSDIMTGLMIIFLFIAISYMVEVRKRDKKIEDVLNIYTQTKEDLYNEINTKLGKDFDQWNVEFDKDLSIKFTNPDILFDSGSAEINPYFSKILNNFLPKYFNIIKQSKYNKKIAEIRIEGHTDDTPIPRYHKDSYIGNIMLSQERSAAVLSFFREMNYYKNLSLKDKKYIEFLLTANGFSYGKSLDSNKNLSFISQKPINKRYSRRVEFKIIPTTESLLEKISELKK